MPTVQERISAFEAKNKGRVGFTSEGKVKGKTKSVAGNWKQLAAHKKAVARQTDGKPRGWKPVPNAAGTAVVGSYIRRGGERGQKIRVKSHRRYHPSD